MQDCLIELSHEIKSILVVVRGTCPVKRMLSKFQTYVSRGQDVKRFGTSAGIKIFVHLENAVDRTGKQEVTLFDPKEMHNI